MKVSNRTKWMIGIGAGLLISLFFLPIPVTQSATVTIEAPFPKVLEQIGSLDRWKRWWPDSSRITVMGDTVFQTPETAYRLERKQTLGLVFTQRDKSVYNLLTVAPSASEKSSLLQWKRVSYLGTAVADKIQSLFSSGHYTPRVLLQHIKESIEDPVKYYGFPIRIEPVEDTFVLVKNLYCTRPEVNSCIKGIYRSVQRYLDSIRYTGRAEKMFHVDLTRRDSVRVMAGFSITRMLDVVPPFQMTRMPKAHIVVGDYEGDYRNIGQIHKAIDAFMRDHRISPVAVVYEKMLTDPRTMKDSMRVRVKVYHPSMIP